MIKNKVVWFTGLSGAGKSTLANLFQKVIKEKSKINCIVLDGDELRAGLNKGLGFSQEDRKENVRRIAETAKVIQKQDCLVVVATISPSFEIRSLAKAIIGEDNYMEVYIKASIETCEKRDVKGLYFKARSNKITNFTGVSDLYEPPHTAFVIDTENNTLDQSVDLLFSFLLEK